MFLVDGYNAIRRTTALLNAETGAGLGAGRRALVATIVASGVLRSSRVLVVFDAGERAAGPPEPSLHPRLSLRFSIPPQNADATILALLEGAKRAGGTGSVTVVTADRELSWQVRRLGAGVVSPEEWAPLRPRPAPRARRESGTERPEKPRASAADVDYWLRVFGDGDAGEDEP